MKFRLLAIGFAALLFAGACTATPEPSASVLYVGTRSWSNGMEESVKVLADGKLIMGHGDHEERVVIPADQMAELAAAAVLPVAAGSDSDDPIIGVTIGSAAPVRPAALTPGSLAALLNTLLDSHTLHP
jgi:hypothetical protein